MGAAGVAPAMPPPPLLHGSNAAPAEAASAAGPAAETGIPVQPLPARSAAASQWSHLTLQGWRLHPPAPAAAEVADPRFEAGVPHAQSERGWTGKRVRARVQMRAGHIVSTTRLLQRQRLWLLVSRHESPCFGSGTSWHAWLSVCNAVSSCICEFDLSSKVTQNCRQAVGRVLVQCSKMHHVQ